MNLANQPRQNMKRLLANKDMT